MENEIGCKVKFIKEILLISISRRGKLEYNFGKCFDSLKNLTH